MHTVQHPVQVPIGLVKKQEKKTTAHMYFFCKRKRKRNA